MRVKGKGMKKREGKQGKGERRWPQNGWLDRRNVLYIVSVLLLITPPLATRERLSASVLSICSFVCLSVC